MITSERIKKLSGNSRTEISENIVLLQIHSFTLVKF